MKNKRTLIETLLCHKQLIIAGTTLLVLFGIVALTQMPRDEFPEFKIRQGLIIGIFPGASSQQVEEQLTKKVENYLFQYEAVDKKKTHSISKENFMVIYVEVQKKRKRAQAILGKTSARIKRTEGTTSFRSNVAYGG